MKRFTWFLMALILLCGCGLIGEKKDGVFLMSAQSGTGDTKHCADFYLGKGADEKKTEAVKEKLRATLTNPAETKCEQSGSTAVCAATLSAVGQNLKTDLFLFSERTKNESTCKSYSGTLTNR